MAHDLYEIAYMSALMTSLVLFAALHNFYKKAEKYDPEYYTSIGSPRLFGKHNLIQNLRDWRALPARSYRASRSRQVFIAGQIAFVLLMFVLLFFFAAAVAIFFV